VPLPDKKLPLRYPGGKQRFLEYLAPLLPEPNSLKGQFFEPFVGGGSVFFSFGFKYAILSDLNREMIDLYRGVRYSPRRVWKKFKAFPTTKRGYYLVRNRDTSDLDLISRAARTLFLNRTCFKGMWRHDADGRFNVGYGGQSRRWVITERHLVAFAQQLRTAALRTADFEEVINEAGKGDFLFLDPPYKPGKREMDHDHYVYAKFGFRDHQRLAKSLHRASKRGARWLLTTSAHPSIRALFPTNFIYPLRTGVGTLPGLIRTRSFEVLIVNYKQTPP
jgi:DNA adenine methylase